MAGSKLKAFLGQWAALTAVALALGLVAAVQPAAAQHKANENDMEVPTNNMEIVQQGRDRYARRCSFCHGSDGHGGKGPCLNCGIFKFTGNTNSEIYVTIAVGVPRSLGGTMGAFGTTLSQEEILSVITFLRWEQNRRIAAGEVPDPKLNKGDELPVFPTTN
jgi:mono/diheme cytochrome c family protein